jgi:hypothetical protein
MRFLIIDEDSVEGSSFGNAVGDGEERRSLNKNGTGRVFPSRGV